MSTRKNSKEKPKEEETPMELKYLLIKSKSKVDIKVPAVITDEELAVAYTIVLKDIKALGRRIDYLLPPNLSEDMIGTRKVLGNLMRSILANLEDKHGIQQTKEENIGDIMKKVLDTLRSKGLGSMPDGQVMEFRLDEEGNVADVNPLKESEEDAGEDSAEEKGDKKDNSNDGEKSFD